MSRVFKRNKNNQAPIFINKLYEMVQDHSHSDIISWTSTGDAFAIKSITRFTEDILPIYFKHRNFASFIRQLNMYGFKKIRHNEGENVYMNENFKSGSKHLLKNINRKIKQEKDQQVQLYANKNNQVSVSRQIQQLRNNQKNLEELCKHFIEQNQRLLEENHTIVRRMEDDEREKDRKLEELLVFLLTQKDNKGIGDNPPEKMLRITNGGQGDQQDYHSPRHQHTEYPQGHYTKNYKESPLEAIGNAMDHNANLQKAREMIQNIYGRKKTRGQNFQKYTRRTPESEISEVPKDSKETDPIFERQVKSVNMLEQPDDNFLSINDFLNVDDDARNHFDLESSY